MPSSPPVIPFQDNWECLQLWGNLFSHIYTSDPHSFGEADVSSSQPFVTTSDPSSVPMTTPPVNPLSAPSVGSLITGQGRPGTGITSSFSSESPLQYPAPCPPPSIIPPPPAVSSDSRSADPVVDISDIRRDVGPEPDSSAPGGPSFFWSLNVRSINKHGEPVFDLLDSSRPAFMALTETWLAPGHPTSPHEFVPEGYVFLSVPRIGKGGGGVGALVLSSLHPLQITAPFTHSSYELLMVQCRPLKGTSVLCCIIYHPPHSHSFFLEELTELCDFLTSSYKQFLLLGDFNIHVNISDDPYALSLKQLLDLRGICLLQDAPTHERGNCLDLILFKGFSPQQPFTHLLSWSDHALIGCSLPDWLPSSKPRHVPAPQSQITIRPWTRLQVPIAQNWLRNHPSKVAPLQVDGMVVFPSTTSLDPTVLSSDLLDRWHKMREDCCPVRTKMAKPPLHLRNRWFTDELLRLKQQGRRLERKWRKSLTLPDKLACRLHLATYKAGIVKAKSEFLASSIQQAPNNTKALFSLVKEFTAPKKPPPFVEDLTTCNNILQYFDDKILKIRQGIMDSQASASNTIHSHGPASSERVWERQALLTTFSIPNSEIFTTLIQKMGPSSSVLDPLPTKVIKTILPALVDDIRTVVNASLTTGEVPRSWKQGIITPLLKKPSADPTVLSNLRPVSQLPFLARIAEAVIGPQLHHHCESRQVFHDIQSGFRPGRGTETALVDVHERISRLLDAAHPAALVLLDLSAAFDTIDHGVLLDRLERVAGVAGSALKWFGSFLAERSQQVRIGAARSGPRPISCGVPQGSALSPVLFNIYMRPLADILEDSGLGCQAYADDTQLIVDLHQKADGGSRLVACLEKIQTWMSVNWLKLNESKTEIILFSQARPHPPLSLPWPPSFGSQPPPVPWARNLGVRFHQSGDLTAQVSNIVSAAHHQLNGITSLMPLLTQGHRATICRALALSRISYCNALLAGLPLREMTRLQKVQNRAVRMVMGLRRRDHISEARKHLRWLKISDDIKLKGLVMTWRALHKVGPLYLQQLFRWNDTLFPARSHLLARAVVPRFQRTRRGGRTLSVLAARWWNALPVRIRQIRQINVFKRQVKAHLFTLEGGAL